MSWYTTAYGIISQQKYDNPDLSHKEIRNFCSKNYPFTERRGYAYKAWLSAMRDHFGAVRKKQSTAQLDMIKEWQ